MSSSVFKSIMQGLSEAAEYQHGNVNARKIKLTKRTNASTGFDDAKCMRSNIGVGQLLAPAQ